MYENIWVFKYLSLSENEIFVVCAMNKNIEELREWNTNILLTFAKLKTNTNIKESIKDVSSILSITLFHWKLFQRHHCYWHSKNWSLKRTFFPTKRQGSANAISIYKDTILISILTSFAGGTCPIYWNSRSPQPDPTATPFN